MTFSAFALCQSEWQRNVSLSQRANTWNISFWNLNRGQFILSTHNNTKLPQSKSLPDIMERRPHWKFFCSKTPCSHFHSCVKEFCVVPPWTKASKRYESFHQSVIIIFILCMSWPLHLQGWKSDFSSSLLKEVTFKRIEISQSLISENVLIDQMSTFDFLEKYFIIFCNSHWKCNLLAFT